MEQYFNPEWRSSVELVGDIVAACEAHSASIEGIRIDVFIAEMFDVFPVRAIILGSNSAEVSASSLGAEIASMMSRLSHAPNLMSETAFERMEEDGIDFQVSDPYRFSESALVDALVERVRRIPGIRKFPVRILPHDGSAEITV